MSLGSRELEHQLRFEVGAAEVSDGAPHKKLRADDRPIGREGREGKKGMGEGGGEGAAETRVAVAEGEVALWHRGWGGGGDGAAATAEVVWAAAA